MIDNVLLLPGSLASILISGSHIIGIARNIEDRHALKKRAASVVDGGGKLAIPGLVNGHCHTYATVLRGTENAQPLEVWALYTMAYGRSLDAGIIRTAVGLSAAEMIRNGVTAVIDHIPHIGLFEHTLAAHVDNGMRVGVAPFMQDIPDHRFLEFDLPENLRAPLETPPPMTATETSNFFENFFEQQSDLPDRLVGMIGPNAPQRCSPELWAVWRNLQEKFDAPVHTHLLETEIQAVHSRKAWQGGLVAEMARQGLLNDKLSVAHGIWLQDHERDLLAEHGVTVIHNPLSNLMLGSGVMPYQQYRQRDVPVGIGSDSANTAGRHDIFEGARLASMLPRLSDSDFEKWPSTANVLETSRRAGARALGLANNLGELAPGMLADLVLLDTENIHTLGPQLNAELIAQHASREIVSDVMIDGNWLLRDSRLTGIDEDQLRSDFLEQRTEMMARAQSEMAFAARTAPVIRDLLRL